MGVQMPVTGSGLQYGPANRHVLLPFSSLPVAGSTATHPATTTWGGRSEMDYGYKLEAQQTLSDGVAKDPAVAITSWGTCTSPSRSSTVAASGSTSFTLTLCMVSGWTLDWLSPAIAAVVLTSFAVSMLLMALLVSRWVVLVRRARVCAYC
jgi:hypothetical protein